MDSRRTTSASSIGNCTLAVVIGIGRSADARIRPLPAAPVEALAIRDALVDPLGCRLRPDHVEFLRDEDATRQAILESIGRACRDASAEHTLFIYFAGHGADVDGQFALVAFDTDVQRCAETGVSARDLEVLLRDAQARGVFLVLDCCGGAALAEGAPGFFRTLGASADHRILLSASRAGQESWEGPKGSIFSQALIEVLTGREQLGEQPGTIYFSDLYKHLHDRVTVDLETAPGGGAQEPMATASYARDPLLFLHAGLTLAQVKVRTQRYSRQQVRAMLLRASIAAAAIVAVTILGLWAYVAGLHFLRVDDGVLALHRGHPALRVLAYPRQVWQYDVRPDELAASSPLAASRPVVSAWGQDFREEALRHLTPSGRARWLISENRMDEARAELAIGSADVRAEERSPHAALLAIAIAKAADSKLLEDLARSPRPEIVTAAVSRLMHVAPDRGVVVAEAMGYGQSTRGVHMQVMAELPPGCSAATQRYLDGFSKGPSNGQFARLQVDAALRTGCVLTDDAIVTFRDPVHLVLVARYLGLADLPRGNGLRESFMQAFTAHLTGAEAKVSLNTAAAYLIGAPAAPACPAVRSLDAVQSQVSRLMVARALVRQCLDVRLELLPTVDGKTFRSELVRGGHSGVRFAVAELRQDTGFGELLLVLDALRIRGTAESSAALEQLALSAQGNAALRREAVRLLRVAGAPARGALASFESGGDQALQTEAYLWLAQADRAQVLARVQSRLGDDTANFLPAVVTRLALTPSEAGAMLQAAQSSQVSERTRTALVAILADAAEVAGQLNDPTAKSRSWLADWLGVRQDIRAVGKLLPTKSLPGGYTARNLQILEDRRSALARELEPKPDRVHDDDSWRIRLMLDMRQIPDAGMRAWLQARCRWCD